jgi:hypothetical protein
MWLICRATPRLSGEGEVRSVGMARLRSAAPGGGHGKSHTMRPCTLRADYVTRADVKIFGRLMGTYWNDEEGSAPRTTGRAARSAGCSTARA